MQNYQENYELSTQERRQKLILKKGSVQLHGGAWDFLESRSMPGIASVASIIRNYVMRGIRNTIYQELDKLTSPAALKSLKHGMLKEFRRRIEPELENAETPANSIAKKIGGTNNDIYLSEIIGYYENNLEKFEDVRNSIINGFLFITDAELVEILGEDDY